MVLKKFLLGAIAVVLVILGFGVTIVYKNASVQPPTDGTSTIVATILAPADTSTGIYPDSVQPPTD